MDFKKEEHMSETSAVVKHESNSIIRTMDDVERAARAMVASGFFADSKQMAQAVVKILAGQELGFGPFASMTGVNIIQNKPVLAANLMANAVKRQGKYNYRVTRLDDTGCELAFLENGQEVGKSKFDEDDAKKAGLLQKDNWKKYPRNMYFARSLSNGQKWYAPDVFNGATVYTPDELGAVVDAEGNAVIDAHTTVLKPVTESTPSPTSAPEASIARPWSAEQVKARITHLVLEYTDKKVTITDAERHILAATLDTTLGGIKIDRYLVTRWLLDWHDGSTKGLQPAQVKALLTWQGVAKFGDVPSEEAIKETHSVLVAAQEAAGQSKLL
jgi:hypothetical protein